MNYQRHAQQPVNDTRSPNSCPAVGVQHQAFLAPCPGNKGANILQRRTEIAPQSSVNIPRFALAHERGFSIWRLKTFVHPNATLNTWERKRGYLLDEVCSSTLETQAADHMEHGNRFSCHRAEDRSALGHRMQRLASRAFFDSTDGPAQPLDAPQRLG